MGITIILGNLALKFTPDSASSPPEVIYVESSRVRNKLRPHVSAEGPHTSFKRNPQTGEITGYETYKPQTNPYNPNPWETEKRVDVTGKPHGRVPTPHVHDPTAPDGIRPAHSDELPR